MFLILRSRNSTAALARAALRVTRTTTAVLALATAVPAQLQFDALGGPELSGGHDETRAVAFGDVDNDGDLDLVAANYGTRDRLYCNDGYGLLIDVTATHLPADRDFSVAVAFGDVDGDGDLDLLFGCESKSRLYLNDGNGMFVDATAARMPAIHDDAGLSSLAFGDVDDDGDLDLVLGCSAGAGARLSPLGRQNRLYLNDGTGTFVDATPTCLPARSELTSAVALGDVDGDGDLDLVVGNWGSWFATGTNRLLLNDGAGVFSDATGAQLPPDFDDTFSIAFGDVDADGDLDLVCGNFRLFYPALPPTPWWLGIYVPRSCVYRNDGTGTFAPEPAFSLWDLGGSALGDVDGDGDLDIAGGGLLCLNDGSGAFADVSGRIPMESWGVVALGDVDLDGDLDLVCGRSGTNCLLFNLQRQLHAPAPPCLGQPYSLEVYARYGAPALYELALPYAAFAPASIPLPGLGVLGIDPNAAVPLPPVLVPQPAGMGGLTIAIPTAPACVGAEILVQALWFSPPHWPRLSNVTRDRLLDQ